MKSYARAARAAKLYPASSEAGLFGALTLTALSTHEQNESFPGTDALGPIQRSQSMTQLQSGSQRVKLSVLDQSPVPVGSTPADALQNTIALARLADRLGYERYWIAEHHAMDTLACPAPEILIARVAAETSAIRVGSGAILLPHYSPLKVVECFRMLHALYPNRIDLGIGRAPGGGPLESFALRRDRKSSAEVDDFPEQFAELLGFLRHTLAKGHPFSQIKVSPEMPGAPDVWLVGSSQWSAMAAAQLGLPYAFAHFIGPDVTRSAIEYYHSHFVPSAENPAPRTLVALGAVCAETQAEAERLFASTRLHIRRIREAKRLPIPTPEQALAELSEGPDPLLYDRGEWPRYIAGTPNQIRPALEQIAAALSVDELMILTVIHDHQARQRSYELLAQAFDLAPRPAQTAPAHTTKA